MAAADTEVRYLKGVGEARAKALAKLPQQQRDILILRFTGV